MMRTYLLSLKSEWLKTRKSSASWLVIIGGLFIPFFMVLIQSIYPEKFSPKVLGDSYWYTLITHSWESMAIVLLPFGIILATSLITQIEYRNNTWKQVYTTPQSYSTLFFAKMTSIIFMMLQFFLINFIGLIISAYLPGLWNGGGFPLATPPIEKLLHYYGLFFIAGLPLIAWQYLISMKFKNFMVGIGVGIAIVVLSFFAFNWKYGYQFPFAHIGMVYLEMSNQSRVPQGVELHLLSLLWFAAITALHYVTYLAQKERS